MHDKALRGIPWTVLAYGVNRLLGVSTTIVLAHLLVPADFGLVALATLVTTLLSLFSGMGMGAALVLRTDRDEREEGTMLWLMLAVGVVFGAAVVALAPLLAGAFDEPRLAPVVRAMAIIFLFSGFNWFYESLLQRELEFRRQFAAQFARILAYSGVAITMAVLGAGVWSLVGGQLASFLAYSLALLVLTPYRTRPVYDRAAAGRALADGRGFVLQGTAEFLQQNADYVAVGRILGVSQLGYYSMAYRQAELPSTAIAIPVANVTFPGFAQMRQGGQDVRPALLSTLRAVVLVTLPLGMILSASSRPFTEALFGDRWLAMIGPLTVMGVWAAVRPVMATLGWFLNSMGEAQVFGRMSMVVVAPHIAALLLAAHFGDITTVAWVMLGHMAVVVALLMRLVQVRAGLAAADSARALVRLAGAGVVCWGATRAAVAAMGSTPPGLALFASALAGVAAYALAIRAADPQLLLDVRRQAARIMSRAPATDAAGETPRDGGPDD
jgi:PST family polysaccharide transporter